MAAEGAVAPEPREAEATSVTRVVVSTSARMPGWTGWQFWRRKERTVRPMTTMPITRIGKAILRSV